MSLLVAAVLGLGLGMVTGMPLGVVNVAIVDAATTGRRRFALGIGIGGAIADTLHAALAFVGLGRIVTQQPELVEILALAAAALILAYAILAWRTRPKSRASVDASSLVRGMTTGFVLTLPNPGALAAWVAVAASLWPDAQIAVASTIAVGVGIGSALWFVLLARLAARIPRDHKANAIIPRVALVILVAIAVFGVVRALA
ncbi:MAG TPA: LysE family transporter [Kofleriaceae bacterium]|nr:LysE family transporter [Kofleriaceae bacterium]